MSSEPQAPGDERAGADRLGAESALQGLQGASRMRGGAVLGPDGEPLAATGAPGAWAELSGRLIEAADSAGDAPAAHVHVATEDGEVFAVRGAGRTIVVVTPRFQLASLMLSDMRAALRQLDGGRQPDDHLDAKTPTTLDGVR